MEYDVREKPQWCPGCGNYGILMAVKQALHELGKKTYETVIVSGIGCGSKIPHYIRSYGYEGIHGRLLPLAEGIKLANPKLTVIAIGGDGDGLSEGTNHFIHSARRNNDINYFVQDNQIYALTTGQASPTSQMGMKTKTTPWGNPVPPIKQLALALINGASFVASTFAGDLPHMKEIFKAAIMHKGFSFVNIYQPCVTWNKLNTYQWWRERIYKLEESNHNARDWKAALEKALEPYNNGFEKVPIGIFYQEEKKSFDDIFEWRREIFNEKFDISEALKEFM